MTNVSAFTREYDLSNYKDEMNYISVNCSGYYRNISGSNMRCNREKGRSDYLLMYCADGNEDVVYQGKAVRMEKGYISLHRPGEPQFLHYNQESSTLYWVHFTGFGCEELLSACGMDVSKVYFAGKSAEVENIFLRLADEIMFKRKDYAKICASLMTYCLLLLGRNISETGTRLGEKTAQQMSEVISYIYGNYSAKITVDSLAALANMSKYEFIRKFKSFSGYTPVDYVINVRMEKAKEIFEKPGISVKTAAIEVGYDNPFYFSRIFKKRNGFSPEHYVRQNRSSHSG